jgi:hypothetical protein
MDYRAYILDENGRICGVKELDCSSDEEARSKAAQMIDGHDLEVWRRKAEDCRAKAQGKVSIAPQAVSRAAHIGSRSPRSWRMCSTTAW